MAGFSFMTTHKVSLSVGQNEYYGWLSVSISSDLEKIARDFSVSLTRRKELGVIPSLSDYSLPIKLGDDVIVKIDGKPVVTGYISKIDISQTANDLSISISGVSLTGVLNDCTAPDGASKSFKQQKIGDIVTELAKMYDIKVIDNVSIVDKKDFTLAVDKTIGSAITDLQRNSGFIVTDDEDGNLVIIKKDQMEKTSGVIAIGNNVVSASRSSDLSCRFKKYVAIGQGKNPKGSEATTNGPKASAEDGDVGRNRVKVFKVTGSVNQAELQKRVDLTCKYLSGAGESIEYEVPGWYDQTGKLWKSGTRLSVHDEMSTGSAETVPMVVKSVTYTLDENGTKTKITVKPETAYTGTDFSSSSEAVEKSAKDKAAKAKKAAKETKKSGSKKASSGASWVLKSGSGKLN